MSPPPLSAVSLSVPFTASSPALEKAVEYLFSDEAEGGLFSPSYPRLQPSGFKELRAVPWNAQLANQKNRFESRREAGTPQTKAAPSPSTSVPQRISGVTPDRRAASDASFHPHNSASSFSSSLSSSLDSPSLSTASSPGPTISLDNGLLSLFPLLSRSFFMATALRRFSLLLLDSFQKSRRHLGSASPVVLGAYLFYRDGEADLSDQISPLDLGGLDGDPQVEARVLRRREMNAMHSPRAGVDLPRIDSNKHLGSGGEHTDRTSAKAGGSWKNQPFELRDFFQTLSYENRRSAGMPETPVAERARHDSKPSVNDQRMVEDFAITSRGPMLPQQGKGELRRLSDAAVTSESPLLPGKKTQHSPSSVVLPSLVSHDQTAETEVRDEGSSRQTERVRVGSPGEDGVHLVGGAESLRGYEERGNGDSDFEGEDTTSVDETPRAEGGREGAHPQTLLLDGSHTAENEQNLIGPELRELESLLQTESFSPGLVQAANSLIRREGADIASLSSLLRSVGPPPRSDIPAAVASLLLNATSSSLLDSSFFPSSQSSSSTAFGSPGTSSRPRVSEGLSGPHASLSSSTQPLPQHRSSAAVRLGGDFPAHVVLGRQDEGAASHSVTAGILFSTSALHSLPVFVSLLWRALLVQEQQRLFLAAMRTTPDTRHSHVAQSSSSVSPNSEATQDATSGEGVSRMLREDLSAAEGRGRNLSFLWRDRSYRSEYSYPRGEEPQRSSSGGQQSLHYGLTTDNSTRQADLDRPAWRGIGREQTMEAQASVPASRHLFPVQVTMLSDGGQQDLTRPALLSPPHGQSSDEAREWKRPGPKTGETTLGLDSREPSVSARVHGEESLREAATDAEQQTGHNGVEEAGWAGMSREMKEQRRSEKKEKKSKKMIEDFLKESLGDIPFVNHPLPASGMVKNSRFLQNVSCSTGGALEPTLISTCTWRFCLARARTLYWSSAVT